MHRLLLGPWLPFAVAAACRLLVARLTEVPARDAAHYLWMAEELVQGRGEALFATVFHPGYSALVGGLLALFPSLTGVAAGQWVACGLGALAVFPLHALTRRRFGRPAAFWAALLYAVGAWFCRHPADCLSEGPFYLLVATWAWLLGRVADGERPASGAILAGLAAAAAYVCRPEGAALGLVGGLWLWARCGGRPAVTLTTAFAAAAALLPVGHALWGGGFTLTPKAGLVYGQGIGGAENGLVHYLVELVRLPGAAFEDLGYLVLPLALYGAAVFRPRSIRAPEWLLLAPFLLQCAVIPLLFSHYRFVSGYGILVMALAGAAAADLVRRMSRQARWLPWVAAALVLGSELARLPRVRRGDRVVERELGHYVRGLLRPGETVATDMPRLAYYAGRQPPPPRPIAAEEILAAAGQPRTTVVAWVCGRTGIAPQELIGLGLESVALPSILAVLVEERDVLVYEKEQ